LQGYTWISSPSDPRLMSLDPTLGSIFTSLIAIEYLAGSDKAHGPLAMEVKFRASRMPHQSAERRDVFEQGITASFGKLLQGIVEHHWSMSWKTICRLRVRGGEALKNSRSWPRDQQYLDVCN
jgi:hypothetical protein